MKIFTAEQVRAWDQYTITHEPISSIELMERAATACADWILRQFPEQSPYTIFCGKGNNGGDGLAIARLLLEKGFTVNIYILEFGHRGTDDFQHNLSRLYLYPQGHIYFIQSEEHIHSLNPGQLVIDALFGSGLNRAVDGLTAQVIQFINHSGSTVIAIDIPSGLFTDHSSKGNLTIQASHTLTFQSYKPAFLVAENQAAVGKLEVLDIGLHRQYEEDTPTPFELVDDTIIHDIYRARPLFAHKGNFGHALLLAGSRGKMGAAVLSSRACLHSGAGLLSCHIPAAGLDILQTAVPEAMAIPDAEQDQISDPGELEKYNAIGIGPGIGQSAATAACLKSVLTRYQHPIVIDADALNILAADPALQSLIPAGSILTPHPKEFERLAGPSVNDFDRIEKARSMARELNVVILLKGQHSLIATAGGKAWFNSTGNPGMATGGSGDVLTGVLTGLLAQGYSPVEAAMLGCYLHGLAGDIAAKELSQEAMIAGDITEYLGRAFLQIQ
jgi:NAD(P)H-hydrate epimerase